MKVNYKVGINNTNSNGEFKVNTTKVGSAVLGVLFLIGSCGSYATVGPGERGVMLTFGKASDTVLESGLHFKLPFISRVQKVSVQIQKAEDTTEAATKDLQRVTATVALNWSIDPVTVTRMVRDFGDEENIEKRIIAPAVSEVLKAAMAKLTAEEVLTKRMELKMSIDDMLLKRLQAYGLVVKDISLTNLDFTKEFNHAVEQKQIAEQQAKQAEYVALKATQDAKAEVETAKGRASAVLIGAEAQAKGQRLLKETLTKDVLKLEYLKKWDGQLPNVMTGNSNGVILNISDKAE